MSQLAAVEKALYFPTPVRIVDLALRHLFVDGHNAHNGSILDICIGEGIAAERLRDGLQKMVGTYDDRRRNDPYAARSMDSGSWKVIGCELDEERGRLAQERLGADNILVCGMEQLAALPHFSEHANIVFLNPPYDQVRGRRIEGRFIVKAAQYLESEGLMILVLTENVLTNQRWLDQIASSIDKANLRVHSTWRFPEPEYQDFKQVVVFLTKVHEWDTAGQVRRLQTPAGVLGEVTRPASWRDLGFSQMRSFVHLDRWRANHGPVLTRFTEEFEPPSPFENGVPVELYGIIGEPGKPLVDMRPLMEMGDPHGAMVAAAGALNGLVIEAGGKRLVARGSTYKTTTSETIEDEDGKKVEVQTDQLVSALAMLDMRTGNVEMADSLNTADRFNEMLLGNARAFVDAAHASYPPICSQATYDRWAPEIARVHAPRKLHGHVNGLFRAQAERVASGLERLQDNQCWILDGEMSVGKAQPLDEVVLTPTGWKRMGQLSVGDQVIGANGSPTTVIGVFPQGKLPVYRCTFTDGSTVMCSDDHLWLVNTPLRRWRGRQPSVKTLREVRHSLAHRNGNLQHFIPMVQPVEFEEGILPLDPYLLGLLIGDGSLSRNPPAFSTADPELLAALKASLPYGVICRYTGQYDYRLSNTYGQGYNYRSPLANALEELGLLPSRSQDKFIPRAYKWGSAETRLAVLQGLIDTDGYVQAASRGIEYCTVSRRLAEDVRFVVQSLGGRASIVVKKTTGRPCFRVWISLPAGMRPCRLARKLKGWRDKAHRQPSRAFKSVQYVGEKECQCIAVDAPDQLYVTRDFIVTHNTAISMATMGILLSKRKPINRKLIIFLPPKDDLLLKWKEEAEKVLREFSPRIVIVPGSGESPGPMTVIQRAMEYEGFVIILMKSTTAKLGSGTLDVPLVKRRRMRFVGIYDKKFDTPADKEYEWRERDGRFALYEVYYLAQCPLCGHTMAHKELADLGSGWKRKCPRCLGTLHTRVGKNGGSIADLQARIDLGRRVSRPIMDKPDDGKRPSVRYPLARWIRDHFPARYALIVDECHEAKTLDSGISYAVTDLTVASWKSMFMTGTLFGGKASSLFQILYRVSPEFRELFTRVEQSEAEGPDGEMVPGPQRRVLAVQEFIDRYGLRQKVIRSSVSDDGVTYSGYNKKRVTVSELPGIHPHMACLLLPCASYLSLDDLDHEMVPYEEHTLFVDPANPAHGRDLETAVRQYLEAAKESAIQSKKDGNLSPMAQYRMARYGITNLPFGPDEAAGVTYGPPMLKAGQVLQDPVTGHVRHIPGVELPPDTIFPKEEALLRLILGERAQGRKVLVFVAQIERRDATPRLLALMQRFNLKGTVMRATEKDRVRFITKAIAGGADAVFCSPQLVHEGIDLVMFSTAIWYGVEFNIYVVPQANRRLWRLHQEQSVKIYYLGYNDFPETTALAYVAEKIAGQQALRGDIRAGLARLLGKDTFLSKLQDAVAQDALRWDHVESDIHMSDLAPLAPAPKKVAAPQAVEVDTAALMARLIVEQEKEWKSVVVRTRKPVTLDTEGQVVQFVMF